MTRSLVIIPPTLLAVAAGGYAVCRAAGWDPNVRSLFAAAAVSAAASVVAFVPVVLARHATQAGVSQAALVGTMAHMMGHVVAAAVVILAKVPLGGAFTYWLTAFYFATLPGLVVGLAGTIRSAPQATPGVTPAATPGVNAAAAKAP